MSEPHHTDDDRRHRHAQNPRAADAAFDLEHARDEIAERPLDPSPRALETLRRTVGLPAMAGDVLVLEGAITRGRPRHGALRSDDHVSQLTLRLPLEALGGDDRHEVPERCPECHHDRATYDLSTHHHIAGRVAVTCPVCDREHHSERWG